MSEKHIALKLYVALYVIPKGNESLYTVIYCTSMIALQNGIKISKLLSLSKINIFLL